MALLGGDRGEGLISASNVIGASMVDSDNERLSEPYMLPAGRDGADGIVNGCGCSSTAEMNEEWLCYSVGASGGYGRKRIFDRVNRFSSLLLRKDVRCQTVSLEANQ